LFTQDAKLGGVAKTPESHAAIQRDLDRLEKRGRAKSCPERGIPPHTSKHRRPNSWEAVLQGRCWWTPI